MKLRLLVKPMLHNASQIRLQRWTGTHWDTMGKLHCPGYIWREMVDMLVRGSASRGIPCEVVDTTKAGAA